ncbi:hypothetical protein UFOVP38_3 [uncultured Caudovirales phage]|uniref:Uncharacterized protein n=1 Tax=uncultured Caudovirales phage TaxID=2100421 RepID=A0A6J5T8R8_9CAUD|nr:hypothetical protein UFOVP38_3 [uncultured Caudovirales phage]
MLLATEQIKIKELAKALARAHVINSNHRKLCLLSGDAPTSKKHMITSAEKKLLAYLQEAGKNATIHSTEEMSVTYTRTKIRKLLRESPDGLTCKEIADYLGVPTPNVFGVIRAMPDTYIDRWDRTVRGQPYSAYWCVVIPPEDCPHPDGEQQDAK